MVLLGPAHCRRGTPRSYRIRVPVPWGISTNAVNSPLSRVPSLPYIKAVNLPADLLVVLSDELIQEPLEGAALQSPNRLLAIFRSRATAGAMPPAGTDLFEPVVEQLLGPDHVLS